MKFKLPGSYRSAADFRARLAELSLSIDVDDECGGAAGPLGQDLEWAPGRRLANRFAIHPMEGWDGTREGSPSDLTRRRWRRFGRSGAAMIWGGEAFAVQADGRANPNQLFLDGEDRAVRDLEALLARSAGGGRRSALRTASAPWGCS